MNFMRLSSSSHAEAARREGVLVVARPAPSADAGWVLKNHLITCCAIHQGALEKRGKETYGPPLGKRLLLWLDDMSMPHRDLYGTQQPLALLRQLLDRKARPWVSDVSWGSLVFSYNYAQVVAHACTMPK